MAKQKKDLSLIVWAFGWLLSLVTAIKKIAARLDVPFEAFDRLGSPEGESTIEKIVRLIQEDYQAGLPEPVMPSADSGHPYRGGALNDSFTALVEYRQPSYADLKKAFDWVYDGYKNMEFKPIDICKGVALDTHEIAFKLVHLNRGASTDRVLAELDRQGFRPALYEELLGFAQKYPDLQREFPIVALGSVYVRPDGRRGVAYLDYGVNGRYLHLSWVGNDWRGDYRFLAVRK